MEKTSVETKTKKTEPEKLEKVETAHKHGKFCIKCNREVYPYNSEKNEIGQWQHINSCSQSFREIRKSLHSDFTSGYRTFPKALRQTILFQLRGR